MHPIIKAILDGCLALDAQITTTTSRHGWLSSCSYGTPDPPLGPFLLHTVRFAAPVAVTRLTRALGADPLFDPRGLALSVEVWEHAHYLDAPRTGDLCVAVVTRTRDSVRPTAVNYKVRPDGTLREAMFG